MEIHQIFDLLRKTLDFKEPDVESLEQTAGSPC